MPTITLTPTACTASASWQDLRYYGNNSGLRQLIFTIPNNPTLGGAGVNITGIALYGYARNSSSAVKRLRFGCKAGTGAAPGSWAQAGGADVLDGAINAAPAAERTGTYSYYRFGRALTGAALGRFAAHMQAQFATGSAVYIGVVQPDQGKSIQVNPALPNWQVQVTYELLGNVPSANVASATLGSTAITTTIQKVVSGSSTTLRYKIGSNTISTVSLGTGTSHTYTVPTSAGQYFPNAQTATLTIEAETFVGSTSYGTVSTSVALKLPSDAAPTATCSPSRTWVSGVADSAKIAAYVQQKSGVSFALSGTAKYGASIASFKVVFNGQAKTRSGNGNISFSPITGSGTLTYTYTVTDSRGLSRSASGTISVLAWSAPKVAGFSVERATADNGLAIEGTYARVTVRATASSLSVSGAQENSISYYVQYRQVGASAWTTCDTVNANAISVNRSELLKDGGAAVGAFNDMEGYEFKLVLSDIYAAANTFDEMPTKEQIWDINQTSGSMGFGGPADRQNMRIVDGVNVKAVASGTGVAAGAYAYVITAPGAPENDDFGISCENGQFKTVSKNAPASQKVAGTMMGGLTSSGVPNIWFFSDKTTATDFNAWLEAQAEAGTPVVVRYEGAGRAFNFYGPIIAQNGVFGVEQFSTLETDTGNVWINGKKIYAKMFTAQTPSTADHQSYLAATMSGMDTVWIDTSATFFARADTGQVYPHGYVSGDGGRQFMVSPDPANNRFVVISDGAGTVYIRLLYTKS